MMNIKKPSRLGRFYLLIHADSKISRSHAELDPTSHQTSKNQDATLNRVQGDVIINLSTLLEVTFTSTRLLNRH